MALRLVARPRHEAGACEAEATPWPSSGGEERQNADDSCFYAYFVVTKGLECQPIKRLQLQRGQAWALRVCDRRWIFMDFVDDLDGTYYGSSPSTYMIYTCKYFIYIYIYTLLYMHVYIIHNSYTYIWAVNHARHKWTDGSGKLY